MTFRLRIFCLWMVGCCNIICWKDKTILPFYCFYIFVKNCGHNCESSVNSLVFSIDLYYLSLHLCHTILIIITIYVFKMFLQLYFSETFLSILVPFHIKLRIYKNALLGFGKNYLKSVGQFGGGLTFLLYWVYQSMNLVCLHLPRSLVSFISTL